MNTVTSADGTTIAYDRTGTGEPLAQGRVRHRPRARHGPRRLRARPTAVS